jgi:hypothetical protein
MPDSREKLANLAFRNFPILIANPNLKVCPPARGVSNIQRKGDRTWITVESFCNSRTTPSN